MHRRIQADRLAAAGASDTQIEELLRYGESTFEEARSELDSTGPAPTFPLADERFVAFWASLVEEARGHGVFAVLRRYLPQLAFPIREGISHSEAYRAATLQGRPVDTLPEAPGLRLERPDLLELELHSSLGGRIPVLLARWRPDFVALIRALTRRNEPAAVSEAQGASMVAGYNNWERIRQLRRAWEARDPAERETSSWREEFARIRALKELYQDRFILLYDGPYSAVPAAELGLGEDEWREISLVIRREHECAHYFTRRFFGSMRNHILDELIADYEGLVAAQGRFRADWFLRFVGLEAYPRYRSGARLDLYRGDPPLTDGAFSVLCGLVRAAAFHLERFDQRWTQSRREPAERVLAIRALASLSLLEVASPEAPELLESALQRL